MNKETAMIIDIPFNVSEHPFWFEFRLLYASSTYKSQNKEWIDYRIDVFMKYTAKSLMNQTNQDFKCIIRYTKETKNLIEEALSKYPKLPNNIIFTYDGDSTIKEIIKDYKYIYHIRLDSDNMFAPDYIEQLHNIKYYKNLQCILSQNGYIYETNKNILAHISHPSPSFYALVYTVDNFLLGLRYYVKDDHWGAMNLTHETIQNNSYVIVVHGKNMDNDFEEILKYPPFRAYIVDDKEKEKVLKIFNI